LVDGEKYGILFILCKNSGTGIGKKFRGHCLFEERSWLFSEVPYKVQIFFPESGLVIHRKLNFKKY
jgi:hypothetical protein